MSLPSNEKGKTDRNNCIKGINYTQIQNTHRKKQRLKIKEDEGPRPGSSLNGWGEQNQMDLQWVDASEISAHVFLCTSTPPVVSLHPSCLQPS